MAGRDDTPAALLSNHALFASELSGVTIVGPNFSLLCLLSGIPGPEYRILEPPPPVAAIGALELGAAAAAVGAAAAAFAFARFLFAFERAK